MALEIQLKHGTAASATANNKTLAQGEIGIETDTLKLKIGDGITAWNGLAYYSTTGGFIDVDFVIEVADWAAGTTCTISGITGMTTTTGNDILFIAKIDQDKWAEFEVFALKAILVNGEQRFTADSTPDADINLTMRIIN